MVSFPFLLFISGMVQIIGLSKVTLIGILNTRQEDVLLSPISMKREVAGFPKFLESYMTALNQSDFVELDHCSLQSVNWTEFHSWAEAIVTEKMSKFEATDGMKKEWILELLEMKATHSGLCHFSRYRPRIKANTTILQEAALKLGNAAKHLSVPPHHVRIVYSIVAYKDSKHLIRLIEAINLPYNLIIIHLEQAQASDSFFREVQEIVAAYPNVVLVKFGTVIYTSDSISRITLQLMHWVVNDLNIEFDYFAALGGAVYPLYGGLELSQYLYASKGNVWLGEATMKGRRIQSSQSHLLWKKRLVTTFTKEAPRAGFLFNNYTVPTWMDRALQHKSNSGNQAIFSYSTIKRMLANSKALHIFALAKYSCCCCVEGKPNITHTLILISAPCNPYLLMVAPFFTFVPSERTWVAVMDVLGLLDEAKQRSCMFQLWGGSVNECKGSMQNAILDLNESRCFRHESLYSENMYFWGNQTWRNLVQARQNGLLFARKFSSSQDGSVQLLEKIKVELHGAQITGISELSR
jgi:hypothetical protein